jgi:RHS repeat-associated protein
VVKLTDGSNNNLSSFTLLDRGYTGHEHLLGVGLVHMNGRLYDPKLHRFLMPDNFVQDPYNTQNFNRYGYVLNNPLSYTDSSGEFFWVAVGIGALIGAITQAVRPGATFGSIFGGALIGGLAGALGAGIGNVVAGGSFFGSQIATTIGFGSGFLSGFTGGFAGGFVGGAGTAWLNGANFGDGLGTGLKGGAIGGITAGLINGVRTGFTAQKMGLDFWSGEGTLDIPYDSSLAGLGGDAEYSNKFARDFSDSNSELSRLSKNVDHLFADGTRPAGYSNINGQLYNPKGISVNGVTELRSSGFMRIEKQISVFLSKSAFRSTAQLYLTLHHEYMHAYFFANNLTFSSKEGHRIINGWHYDQARIWNSIGGPISDRIYSTVFNYSDFTRFAPIIGPNHYSRFGFRTINYIP